MEFRIAKTPNLEGEYRYYVVIKNKVREFARDQHIAEIIRISTREYRNILRKSNGKKLLGGNNEIFFDNFFDANTAIAMLEPYLIMVKLTEE